MIRTAWRGDYPIPVLVAVVLGALAMTEVAAGEWPVSTPAAVLWAVAAVAPVAFLRAHPVAAWLTFVALIGVLLQLAGEPQSAALFFTTVGLAFGVGAFTEERRWLRPLTPTLLLLVATLTFHDRENTRLSQRVPELVLTTALVTLAVGAGALVRRRSATARSARLDAVRAAEESRSSAERAIADERARIARDLHDVVAHSVSLMVVQAVGGRAVLERRPAVAVEACEAITTAGDRALDELRRMLDVLGEPTPDLGRRPGLAALPDLLASARSAGLDVSCDVEGEIAQVPSGVGLAAYRILQEGLTNALKHSAARVASVSVTVGEGRVVVAVTNPVQPPSQPGSGSGLGLAGMRERAGMYGGHVDAGAAEGVWSTRATLRLEP